MTTAVISIGLCYATICTDEADLDVAVTQARQLLGPSGTTRGWQRSEDERFATGQPNPCPCEQNSEARHLLLDC